MELLNPKGIRNLGKDDSKIQFYQTIMEIGERLDDPNVILQSFIVSNTPSTEMSMLWSMGKEEIQQRNILFQQEDGDS
jgi:hypothetical protein